MPIEHEALRAAGLTEYGARAYRAIIARGESTAAEVATAAPIPRTKVYAVLANLVERGWVDVEAGRPKRYRPRRPRDAFARERERIASLVEGALPRLEAQFSDRGTRFAGALWLLTGAEAVTARALAMTRNAKREVLLVAPFEAPGDVELLAPALRDASRRGVRVRFLVPDPSMPHARALLGAGGEARAGFIPVRFFLVDAREALITLPPDPREPSGEIRAIWNPSPELAGLMAQVLPFVWEMGEPLPVTATPERRPGRGAGRRTRPARAGTRP